MERALINPVDRYRTDALADTRASESRAINAFLLEFLYICVRLRFLLIPRIYLYKCMISISFLQTCGFHILIDNTSLICNNIVQT